MLQPVEVALGAHLEPGFCERGNSCSRDGEMAIGCFCNRFVRPLDYEALIRARTDAHLHAHLEAEIRGVFKPFQGLSERGRYRPPL